MYHRTAGKGYPLTEQDSTMGWPNSNSVLSLGTVTCTDPGMRGGGKEGRGEGLKTNLNEAVIPLPLFSDISFLIFKLYLNWHSAWVDLERELVPGHLAQSVVRQHGVDAGVVHVGRADAQGAVRELTDPEDQEGKTPGTINVNNNENNSQKLHHSTAVKKNTLSLTTTVQTFSSQTFHPLLPCRRFPP